MSCSPSFLVNEAFERSAAGEPVPAIWAYTNRHIQLILNTSEHVSDTCVNVRRKRRATGDPDLGGEAYIARSGVVNAATESTSLVRVRSHSCCSQQGTHIEQCTIFLARRAEETRAKQWG